jgi:hypothetical protein
VSSLTSNDSKLPSAYSMKELANLSKTSRIEAPSIWLLLMQKIQTAQPPAKLKALRVVKFMLENGSPDFRIVVRRDQSQTVRAMTTYKGPQSQLTGDAVNQKIRDMAKETMQVLQQSINSSYSQNQPDPTLQGMHVSLAYPHI